MSYQKDKSVLTVSELTHSIKTILELQYRFVNIQGEVSNIRTPFSGHIYFTLKDSNAQIRAVLFKGQQKFLSQKIEDGQSIICHGRLTVYETRGEYQIIVDTVDFSGLGSLQLEFERLKRKLADEGLFERDRKKEIPNFPEHIVLITSPTGAAVHDYLKISYNRRFYGKISVVPVSVQGESAATEIAGALRATCDRIKPDLIILMRGGGSLEDLWAFNEEKTARAIYSSTIPIVTGIGHEIDYTIADMCADLHAHTPTAAAETTIPNCVILKDEVDLIKKQLIQAINRYVIDNQKTVKGLVRVIGDLDLYLSNFALKIDHSTSKLTHAIQQRFVQSSSNLEITVDRLKQQAPYHRLSSSQSKVQFLRKEIEAKMIRFLERKREKLGRQAAVMDSVSPLSTLSRGYSVVSHSERNRKGKVISQTSQVNTGDVIDILLHKGELVCEVLTKKNDSKQ